MRTPKRVRELPRLRQLARSLRDEASNIDSVGQNNLSVPELFKLESASLQLRNVANELEVWAGFLERGTK